MQPRVWLDAPLPLWGTPNDMVQCIPRAFCALYARFGSERQRPGTISTCSGCGTLPLLQPFLRRPGSFV